MLWTSRAPCSTRRISSGRVSGRYEDEIRVHGPEADGFFNEIFAEMTHPWRRGQPSHRVANFRRHASSSPRVIPADESGDFRQICLGRWGENETFHWRAARRWRLCAASSRKTSSPLRSSPRLACPRPSPTLARTSPSAAWRNLSRSSSSRSPSRTTSLADWYRPDATRDATKRPSFGVSEMFIVVRLAMLSGYLD